MKILDVELTSCYSRRPAGIHLPFHITEHCGQLRNTWCMLPFFALFPTLSLCHTFSCVLDETAGSKLVPHVLLLKNYTTPVFFVNSYAQLSRNSRIFTSTSKADCVSISSTLSFFAPSNPST